MKTDDDKGKVDGKDVDKDNGKKVYPDADDDYDDVRIPQNDVKKAPGDPDDDGWSAVPSVSSGGKVLSTVAAALPDLRGLSVTFVEYTRLPAAEILALRGLVDLEELTIGDGGDDDAAIVEVDWAPDDFIALVTPLRQLRVLKLDIVAKMAPRHFREVGLACPRLRELEMPDAVYDLEALYEPPHDPGNGPPRFPHLERLVVLSFDMAKAYPDLIR
jgi:hypothetical protein